MERAGGIIRTKYNSEYYYLLVQGRDTCKWSFPKGHIDAGETYLECAIREILEETGINLQGVKHNGLVKLRYIYFLYNLPCKYLTKHSELLKINDHEEVVNIKWFTVEGMKKIEGNIDVKKFVLQQELLSGSDSIRKNCAYGENCQNVFCRFWHPAETEQKHYERCHCNDTIYFQVSDSENVSESKQFIKEPIKKPRNSYCFFVMENRETIKKSFPNLSGKSLATKISYLWKQAPEDIKQKYIEMANDDKIRYKKEIEDK
jgi:8-oxo-dGTP pyrophosphatase MutT (NUDIX family)